VGPAFRSASGAPAAPVVHEALHFFRISARADESTATTRARRPDPDSDEEVRTDQEQPPAPLRETDERGIHHTSQSRPPAGPARDRRCSLRASPTAENPRRVFRSLQVRAQERTRLRPVELRPSSGRHRPRTIRSAAPLERATLIGGRARDPPPRRVLSIPRDRGVRRRQSPPQARTLQQLRQRRVEPEHPSLVPSRTQIGQRSDARLAESTSPQMRSRARRHGAAQPARAGHPFRKVSHRPCAVLTRCARLAREDRL